MKKVAVVGNQGIQSQVLILRLITIRSRVDKGICLNSLGNFMHVIGNTYRTKQSYQTEQKHPGFHDRAAAQIFKNVCCLFLHGGANLRPEGHNVNV